MPDVRNEKLLRPRRQVLSAPGRRALDTGSARSGGGAQSGGDSAGRGDDWVEQSPGTGEPQEALTQLAYVAPERDPVDMELDRLLILWHEVTSTYRFEQSYRPPAVTSSYESPKHHDWQHGIVDEMTEKITCRRIGDCIRRLEHPWQTAIVLQARNLATGADVWFSPRLPVDREAREVILLEARNKLLVELRRDGVLT